MIADAGCVSSSATTHLPLRAVADILTQARIGTRYRIAVQACADLGLTESRIAVCGLNPAR